MKKTILNGVILGVSFLITVWLGSLVWGALTTVTSGIPLTATTWNDMISNFFWKLNGAKIYYNSGNVGIGTSSPNSLLNIYSNTSSTVLQLNGGSSVSPQLRILDGNATPKGYAIGVGQSTYTDGNFFISDISVGARLLINTSGNVGIGTTNPSSKLDVEGQINAGVGGNKGAVVHKPCTIRSASSTNTVSCQAGEQVVGGGVICDTTVTSASRASFPSGNGWYGECSNHTVYNANPNAIYAICCRVD